MPRRQARSALMLCAALALPLALPACVSETTAPPPAAALDYSTYSKLPLNVASLQIQQNYFASGQPPDVSADDPLNPVTALRQMATERLQTVGASGRAVFSIDNASMIEQGNELIGAFTVTLSIYDDRGTRVGYASATATRQLVGFGEDLRGALYSLTSELMQQMNVEFERQVRRSLGPWLLTAAVTPAPVEQVPLQPGAPAVMAPGVPVQPTPYGTPPPYPPAGQPQGTQQGAPIPLTPPGYTPGAPPPPMAISPPVITAPSGPAAPPYQPPEAAPVPGPAPSLAPPVTPAPPPPAVAPAPPPPAAAPPSNLPPLGPVVE